MSEQEADTGGGNAESGASDTTTAAQDTSTADNGSEAKKPENQEEDTGSKDAEAGNEGGESADTDDGTKPEGSSDFTIPEEYKKAPWASKVKSQEDVWKQLENLQTLVGKKSLPPISADASEEDVKKYYEAVRPESPDVYDFGERNDDEYAVKKDSIGKLLHDNGIMPQQAKALIEGYNALETAALETATSADGYKEEMVKTFGDKYDEHVVETTKHFENHLSQEDQAIFDKLPNKFLGAMYRYTKSIREAYGINEGGDEKHGEEPGGVGTKDINEYRSGLRKEIAALEKRPHTADQKQQLVDKLNNTYKQKG